MDGLVGSEIKPDPSLPHCDYQPFRLGGGGVDWVGWGDRGLRFYSYTAVACTGASNIGAEHAV